MGETEMAGCSSRVVLGTLQNSDFALVSFILTSVPAVLMATNHKNNEIFRVLLKTDQV
jgi:hypothetical protein